MEFEEISNDDVQGVNDNEIQIQKDMEVSRYCFKHLL